MEAKYRHELKNVVSQSQIALLKMRIEPFMELDPHVLDKGYYDIRSLYFDDYENSCYYDNLNGNDPREKFRIRIYNGSSERINLECKRKECGKTKKTSCIITKEQFDNILNGMPDGDNNPLLNKFLLQINTKLLRPKIIVQYKRIPYIFNNGNVRITFDTDIESSSDVGAFFNKEIATRPIMPNGKHLLEVKFDEFLPDFIYRALNLGELQQTAYSKYCLCRKYSLE